MSRLTARIYYRISTETGLYVARVDTLQNVTKYLMQNVITFLMHKLCSNAKCNTCRSRMTLMVLQNKHHHAVSSTQAGNCQSSNANFTVILYQLPLKTQQRFSVFTPCFDVSNIIISHYKRIERFYKMIGIYNYSIRHKIYFYKFKHSLTVKLI